MTHEYIFMICRSVCKDVGESRHWCNATRLQKCLRSARCGSVLQRVAVCCSVLQRVAVYHNVLQRVVVCCRCYGNHYVHRFVNALVCLPSRKCLFKRLTWLILVCAMTLAHTRHCSTSQTSHFCMSHVILKSESFMSHVALKNVSPGSWIMSH